MVKEGSRVLSDNLQNACARLRLGVITSTKNRQIAEIHVRCRAALQHNVVPPFSRASQHSILVCLKPGDDLIGPFAGHLHFRQVLVRGRLRARRSLYEHECLIHAPALSVQVEGSHADFSILINTRLDTVVFLARMGCRNSPKRMTECADL